MDELLVARFTTKFHNKSHLIPAQALCLLLLAVAVVVLVEKSKTELGNEWYYQELLQRGIKQIRTAPDHNLYNSI